MKEIKFKKFNNNPKKNICGDLMSLNNYTKDLNKRIGML